MDCSNSIGSSDSPYELLLRALSLIPISHYLFGFLFIFLSFLYNFLEMHILQDIFTGFRGQPVSLTFNSCSEVYQEVASKCRILHGRYMATPWLTSPHLQTAFLCFFGRPPVFSYRRQLFHMSDGGTIALDWLMNSDVPEAALQVSRAILEDDKTPIIIVIPGLTSDSASAYIKHLAFKMAQNGWNVVVSNHRGLGGISITSDCFYNAGWTDDIRKVIDNIHCQYPEAPLFAVGTSIGANVLVKYLGEDGIDTPVVGAAAICSTWDLLICDRFINRRLVQKFYDKVLTIGLKGYAHLHQSILARLADWEGIKKSRSVRDFDTYATCLVGKFETVDTYYRHCSSAAFVGNVMVPLLCISALDDPVCTMEAIPWDECRANKNIILATTSHGGHLAYFEGTTAKSLWWVRAVDEFLSVLHSSSLIHRKKEMQIPSSVGPLESSIDQGPYVNVMNDGMVTALGNGQTTSLEDTHNENMVQREKDDDMFSATRANNHMTGEETGEEMHLTSDTAQPSKHDIDSAVAPVRRCVDQLSRQSSKSIWLLVYIAVITTWPLVGSALLMFLKKKFRNVLPAMMQRR
ncbi:embryogenesis-associated protein EMB8-like isoform X2 [Cornus florida]|uniref:embryogenesis-associated protein EMB8-like isoform X2 n=1 Tax=Cornus florida TaxID=4283 RepID=UPI00289EE707|nr:embryogenesis-associated protein EMB8-like isoform X2 [Cornus florida]